MARLMQTFCKHLVRVNVIHFQLHWQMLLKRSSGSTAQGLGLRAARSCKYKLLPSSTDLTREQPHGNAASCSFIASTSQNKKVFTWKDENKKQT